MIEKDKTGAFHGAFFSALLILCLLVLAVLLSGCGAVKYVPVETVRIDSITHTRIDTVRIVEKSMAETRNNVKDSIRESIKEQTVITVNLQGDTLRTDRTTEIVKDRFLKEENERLLALVDSLREVSLSVEKDVEIVYQDRPYPVEKSLSRWQRIKMDFGGLAMGGTAVAIAFIIVWVIKRFRK